MSSPVSSAALAHAESRTPPPKAARVRGPRNEAIDCLRGIVMIVMALDHTRSFIGPSVDTAIAGPALFFTRWITHYCAPVFVMLAGTAAWLHGRRLASTKELSAFLLSRGLWLIVVEVVVLRAVILFYLGPEILVLQVIWAIGASMVVLAGLVWLPLPAIAAIALVTIGGHNLLDGVKADDLGAFRWLWVLLHEEGPLVPFEGAQWFVVYPLVPWFAVMAAGYALGPWMTLPTAERRRRFCALGAVLTVGFVVLRASDSLR